MKKLLIKIATCIVGFICVLVIYFLSIYEKRATTTEIMQSATLPMWSSVRFMRAIPPLANWVCLLRRAA